MPRQCQTAIITETVVADVTTQTAADTLRRDMGLGANLVGIHRKDAWLFRLDTNDPAAAESQTRHLAEKTKLFVNPNKHRFQVTAFPLVAVPTDPRKLEDGSFQFTFIVRFREDTRGAVALGTLRKLYGAGEGIVSIDYGMLWEVTLKAASAEAASALFSRILIAKNQSTGLFVNPHSQVVLFPEREMAAA